MKSQIFIPSDALKPFISRYLIIESDEELVNRVLPDTALVMVMRYKGKVLSIHGNEKKELPTYGISGLRKSGRLFNYIKGTGVVLVHFKETCAVSFFKEPLHELYDESVSLDQLINKERLAIAEDESHQANNHVERIQVVERFLSSVLTYKEPDALVLEAMRRIRQSNGSCKMKELADSLHISQDAFEKRFRRSAGASPKRYASIIRMRTLIQKSLRAQNLSDLVFDAGYFDQAHFNKDFKLFTGQSPTEFLKSPIYW
jgi:AraC-like DNA-binding protein